jgi:RNA polymerase sigma factor (sigma-70 family)
LSFELENIIQLCQMQDPQAQKQLYEKYKDNLYAVCIRYVSNSQEAEDVFINGFYKILTKIDSYSGEGNFENWMRRIMVNESLMHLRKYAALKMKTVPLETAISEEEWQEGEDEMTYDDVIKLLNKLPIGYRTIFNLYVFENYNHREIGEILNISINTSKSQYLMAKKKLIELYHQDKNRR